jgi:hypothetical protein
MLDADAEQLRDDTSRQAVGLRNEVDCGTPETMLEVAPGAEAGVPIDAITAACSRADAVLHLLQTQFESPEGRASDAVILDALWGIQGSIEIISKLAHHGYHSTHPSNRRGGGQ